MSKINYGIDLGTTNSAISRMENGVPVIKKSDNLKDTMPSCVYINRRQAIQVGDSAYGALKLDKLKAMKDSNFKSNAFIEFKRTMGTDKKYYSSHLEKDFSSEELSAEVLKTLKSFISDESFKSIVITVPAKFTVNQRDATLRAAELAGFEHCELLQEPIAASMAYGLDSINKDGHWLVFDFGGGTFDVALLRVEEGIMKVIDTEGDSFLGGKNLDYAIVDEIIIPYLQEKYSIESIISDLNKKQIFQDALKRFAEETKIQMSFKESYNLLSGLGDLPEDEEGEEIEIDILVTQEMMQNTLGPIFQKSIDICKQMLKRKNIEGNSLNSLILVGGPTYSPILRKMLEEQITKPDVSVDPMTVVSKGAALFASTVDVPDHIGEKQRDKTKIQLKLGYEATTVNEEELISVIVLKDKTEGEVPDKVFVEIVRGDKAWSSGKVELEGKNDKGEKAGAIELKFNLGKPNLFNVYTYNEQGDLLPSEPSSFTIIQGSRIGSPTLPYFFGLEIKSRASGKVVFRSIKGLEKNQSTPATGTTNGLKTQKQIRPGMKEDSLKIPLYQGEHGADGTRAIHNEHVYDVIISGDDLPKLLPEGSDVDLTVKVDKSERITLSAFFPALDYAHEIEVPSNTTQKEIDANWLECEINKAQQTLNLIRQEGVYSDEEKLNSLDAEISETKKRFEQGKSDYDRKKDVLDTLRRSLKKLDEIQASSEWPKTEEELKDVFYRLEETNQKFGNDKTTAIIEQFKEQIPEIIKEKNVKVAQEMIDNMRQLDFALIDQGMGAQFEITLLHHFNDDFDTLDWKDRSRARITLDKGFQIAATNPTKAALRPIVIELYNLLPDAQKPIIGGGSGNELVG
jgi:molecular chaperone DnaK